MKNPSVRTKVLVQHLPPSLSQSDFIQQIDHFFCDRHNWFCFQIMDDHTNTENLQAIRHS
ncbi:putative regulator of nonsense-mediated decay, UPF3 [Rosa chinensis]|uniref:Putative regulator of nonsense-mediated decay, UPF3 n=1 Tax=Rosa chinensis TaxID=74649 RepID=A0A2P6PQU6_ROSCH|nr:putative regulator of nonsense-mediated decay, UPF3 [Rosa chinensis]